MNHKLRVFVRVDVDPARVALEITGCVTLSDSAALLHIVRRACRLEPGADVLIDLYRTTHLDPEVLLDLRRLADAGPLALPAADPGDTLASRRCRITLAEPSELPICLQHVGAHAEVLGGLEAGPSPVSLAAGQHGSAAAGLLDVGLDAEADSGMGASNSPVAGECGAADDSDTFSGLALSEYFEDTLDPAATVRALSDTALCRLADALYRHLDTSDPVFGAHTWYELASEEIQSRHLADGDGPAAGEVESDTALA